MIRRTMIRRAFFLSLQHRIFSRAEQITFRGIDLICIRADFRCNTWGNICRCCYSDASVEVVIYKRKNCALTGAHTHGDECESHYCKNENLIILPCVMFSEFDTSNGDRITRNMSKRTNHYYSFDIVVFTGGTSTRKIVNTFWRRTNKHSIHAITTSMTSTY